MLSSDNIERIGVEVATGKPPAKPDDADMAELRASMQKTHEKAVALGGSLMVHFEYPDLDGS